MWCSSLGLAPMVQKYFPNKQFRAFLFDFDGTVADTMPAHLNAWNLALGNYGLSLSSKQHQEWAGIPTKGILKMIGEKHGIEFHVDQFLKEKEVHYFNSIEQVKGIVPVVEIIKASYKKIPMAVVSGSRRHPIETTLKKLEMSHYFDLIVSAEDYVNGKPAPDCFLQAAKALNVKPEDCLVFEDAELGIKAAHAAGMDCLKVVPHDSLGHELKHV
jgi:beta-phosphoglucomutase family hydrolase